MVASTIGDKVPFVPGFLYCLVIALVSHATEAIYEPISSLFWAIVYGILIVNVFQIPKRLVPGINFCANQLVEGTVALMGLVVSTTTLLQVGCGILNIILIIFITLFFCLQLGKKMGLSDRLTALMGAGMSICGSHAVVEAAVKLDAKEDEIRIALDCTNFFSIVSMFTYPLFFAFTSLNQWLLGDFNAYALWIGFSVPEIPHVIAAAGVLGFDYIGPALVIKMLRVLMISPAIFLLYHLLNWNEKVASKGPTSRFVLPTYSIIFIINIFLCTFMETNSVKLGLGSLWIGLQDVLTKAILPLFLTTSLVGVGSRLNIRNVLRIGARPLTLAALVTFMVGFLSLVLTITTSSLI
jgi:uncharacterized integral membrane protein (TIGR00698 family)